MRLRPDAQHVSEAFGGGAARVRGFVLQRLLFGPGHLDPAVVLGAAPARPLSLPISLVVVVRADAGEPEHGVPILHQLGLSSDTQILFHTFFFFFFFLSWIRRHPQNTPTDNRPHLSILRRNACRSKWIYHFFSDLAVLCGNSRAHGCLQHARLINEADLICCNKEGQLWQQLRAIFSIRFKLYTLIMLNYLLQR